MDRPPYQVCEPLSAADYASLRASIQTYGCLSPVEVDEEGEVIDGHHRVLVCEELGLSYERVVIAGLTHDQKVARAIEVNNVRRAPKWRTRQERDARIVELRRQGLSTTLIAEEVGVSPDTAARNCTSADAEVDFPAETVGKDGKRRVAAMPDRSPEAVAERRARVSDLYSSGVPVREIAAAVGISVSAVFVALDALGTPRRGSGVRGQGGLSADRYERVRELAAEGHTSAQIAAEVGMTEASLRESCRRRGIRIPADAVLGRSHKHDPNRIVRETVHALEGAVVGLRLIDLDGLDRSEIGHWTASLTDSIRALNRLNKQMKEMVQ